MRKISTKKITDVVSRLVLKANFSLRKDVLSSLKRAALSEKSPLGKSILKILIENARIAEKEGLAICQYTGIAVVFCEIGQKVHVGGDIDKAINEGIRLGYKKGCLRKSVVSDPIIRKNTGTNTPSIIHYSFNKSDKLRLTVLPKGFGCENASKVFMLKPTATEEEIIESVVGAVKEQGADACPPLILGIGIGGTLDKAATLSKEATLLPVNKTNPKKHLKRLESLILKRVNETGIGPAGLGGKTTCLGVNILSFPTHIAGLPVVVNINCHALRSAESLI
ncbi:MAG: fumarate hydratase [Candidatus Omnitrophica bacterium]|nr:fumarate hydratase [Candidatus Omnitrophota bacterium]